jgi:hypothetical protein
MSTIINLRLTSQVQQWRLTSKFNIECMLDVSINLSPTSSRCDEHCYLCLEFEKLYHQSRFSLQQESSHINTLPPLTLRPKQAFQEQNWGNYFLVQNESQIGYFRPQLFVHAEFASVVNDKTINCQHYHGSNS